MARKGTFKCSLCDRTFGMAAHLGRHMSTMHGRKSKKRAMGMKRIGRPRKAIAIGLARVAGPAALVDAMEAYRTDLSAQQATLQAQMAVLEDALSCLRGLGSKPARAPRAFVRRGRGGKKTLKAHIEQVLRTRGQPMMVKQIAAAVSKAGHQSRSADLPKQVGKTLAMMPGVAKVSRGLFRIK